MLQISAQADLVETHEQFCEPQEIKDELLSLYNTEPQLCKPYFSSSAHTMLELQKIPSHDVWSWVKNYINSYVQQPYFRVTPEKAPYTTAYLKTIAEKMGLDTVPDLYLSQNSWNPYNANSGSVFLERTDELCSSFVQGAINYAIVTNVEDEWKIPMLTLRYVVPALGAVLFKKFINPTDRIVIYDKTMVETFSENSIRATLAHEAGHIKNNDHEINNIVYNLSKCVTYASAYYIMTNNTTKSFLNTLSPSIYVPLNQLMNQFNIDLLGNHNFENIINNNLIPALVIELLAKNLHALLCAKRSRFIEYRADLEEAHAVGFENAIKDLEEWQELLEHNAERDFALIPPSDNSVVNFWIWLLKKSEQFKEWKTANSPFRSHPTHRQRIDYLKQQAH